MMKPATTMSAEAKWSRICQQVRVGRFSGRRSALVVFMSGVFAVVMLVSSGIAGGFLPRAAAATSSTATLIPGDSVNTPLVTQAPQTSSFDWAAPVDTASGASPTPSVSGSWLNPATAPTAHVTIFQSDTTINMANSFNMTYWEKGYSGYSQGIYFVPSATTQTQLLNTANMSGGGNSGNLGIGAANGSVTSPATSAGIPNSIFVGRDYYYDSSQGDYCGNGFGIPVILIGQVCTTTGPGSPANLTANPGSQIAIRTTDSNGKLVAANSSGSATVSAAANATANTTANPTADGGGTPSSGNNPGDQVAISWTPNAGQTVLNSTTSIIGTLTATIGNATVTYNNLVMQLTMNFGANFAAGNWTGANSNSFSMQTISANAVAPVTVRYVDSSGNSIAPSTIINASVNSSLGIIPNNVAPNDPTKFDYALPAMTGHTLINIQGTNGSLVNPCTNGSSGTCGTASNPAVTTTFASIAPVTNSATTNVVTATYSANPQTVYYAYATGYSSGSNGLTYPAQPSPQTGVTGTPIIPLTSATLPAAPAGYYWSAVRYNGKYYAFSQANQMNPTATWNTNSAVAGQSGTTIYDAMALAVAAAGGDTGTMDGNTINSTTGNSNAGSSQPPNFPPGGVAAGNAADNSFMIMTTQLPLVTGTVTFSVPSSLANPGPITLNQGTNATALSQKGYLGGSVNYTATNAAVAAIPNGYNVSIQAPNGIVYTSTQGTAADIRTTMATAEAANSAYSNEANVAISGNQDTATYANTFNYVITVTAFTQTASYTYGYASGSANPPQAPSPLTSTDLIGSAVTPPSGWNTAPQIPAGYYIKAVYVGSDNSGQLISSSPVNGSNAGWPAGQTYSIGGNQYYVELDLTYLTATGAVAQLAGTHVTGALMAAFGAVIVVAAVSAIRANRRSVR